MPPAPSPTSPRSRADLGGCVVRQPCRVGKGAAVLFPLAQSQWRRAHRLAAGMPPDGGHAAACRRLLCPPYTPFAWPWIASLALAMTEEGDDTLHCHARAGGHPVRRGLSVDHCRLGVLDRPVKPGDDGCGLGRTVVVTRPSSPPSSLRGALAPKQSRSREGRLSAWPLDRFGARDDGVPEQMTSQKNKPRPAGGTGQGLLHLAACGGVGDQMQLDNYSTT